MLTKPQAGAQAARFGLPATDLTMILVVLIWGTNFSMIKISLVQIPPMAFAALRFTGAALVLWLIMRWREGAVSLPSRSLWKLTWIGIVGNTFYQIFFTYGLSITTAANGALLIAIVPTLVALSGALLGIERLTRNIGAGVALAFLGVCLVVAARGGAALSLETIVGDLLMLGCAVSWTIYTLGVRTLAAGISPLRITTMTMVTGVPGLLLLSIPDLLRNDWLAVSPAAWGGLAYATLLGLVVAYVLWNNSVRLVGGNRTAIYGCAIPLVAALAAWLLLDERLVPLQGVGAALIVAGVLLTRRR